MDRQAYRLSCRLQTLQEKLRITLAEAEHLRDEIDDCTKRFLDRAMNDTNDPEVDITGMVDSAHSDISKQGQREIFTPHMRVKISVRGKHFGRLATLDKKRGSMQWWMYLDPISGNKDSIRVYKKSSSLKPA